jgi:hypothetical protein
MRHEIVPARAEGGERPSITCSGVGLWVSDRLLDSDPPLPSRRYRARECHGNRAGADDKLQWLARHHVVHGDVAGLRGCGNVVRERSCSFGDRARFVDDPDSRCGGRLQLVPRVLIGAGLGLGGHASEERAQGDYRQETVGHAAF